MAITLIVSGVDLTEKAQGLQWTLVDPGGCETCSFNLPTVEKVPLPGARVRVFEGLQCLFDGYVEEPGDDLDERQAPGQVTAVGAGAVMKDGRMSMVFMDRDVGRWQPMGRARQLAVLGAALGNQGFQTLPDPTSGSPAIDSGWTGDWNTKPLSEAWYDAGNGNLIDRIKADWIRGANVPNSSPWTWDALLSSDDALAALDSSGNLRAAGPGTLNLAASGSRRFAALQLYYDTGGAAGTAGQTYDVMWTNVRVIGDHGLTIRGATAATEGFYPADIVRYVLGLVTGLAEGVIIDDTSYITTHSVYRDPVTHETPIDDMAKLTGWHWGVWPARSMFSDTPELHFRPPPPSATVIVAREDCRQLKLVQRLSDFHDTALVKYSDPAGTSGYVTRTLANPRLPSGRSRTLDLDAGIATAAFAAQLGDAALALEQQQSRAAGPVQLPGIVQYKGGPRLAHTIQPGIDRLKITGLPNAGPWTETDTRRFDTFRIQRLTCSVDGDGFVTTTADLDSGVNLLDVAQARLAAAAVSA